MQGIGCFPDCSEQQHDKSHALKKREIPQTCFHPTSLFGIGRPPMPSPKMMSRGLVRDLKSTYEATYGMSKVKKWVGVWVGVLGVQSCQDDVRYRRHVGSKESMTSCQLRQGVPG